MAKLKYYQLAVKNGTFKKLVSPGSSTISQMILDGWNFYGYDNEADIPANPILDNGEVREMSTAEIETAEQANKLARAVFMAKEIIEAIEAVDQENNNTALSDKLQAVLSNSPEFSIYWSAYNDAIDLEHSLCVQALANFTAAEIEALKLKIS